MKLITLPRLRMAQLQMLVENVLNICSNLTEIKKEVKNVKSNFEDFKEGMLKRRPTSEDKKGLDKIRDNMVTAFTQSINAETYFPHKEPEALDNLKKLTDIVHKYGTKINKLPYNEETSVVDNMIAEAEEVNYSALGNGSISRWIPLLKEANQNFKDLVSENIEESAEALGTDTASELAPDLTNAVEKLFTMIFSHINVSGNEALRKAHVELEQLVDSLR